MDPVQNLSIKIKKVSMDLIHDRGSMKPVQSGGPWTRGPCFVFWVQSNQRIEFSNLSFPIAHLPAGRLTCANSGEILVTDPPYSGFMNGGRQNFPSACRLIAHLIAYIKSNKRFGEWCYGFDLSMLILQHSVWSWSLWTLWSFYMLFNCYFKECFSAKGRTKIVTLIFEIVFTWISKIMYQDGSTMLQAICHVIDVWYNFPRPEHSWL